MWMRQSISKWRKKARKVWSVLKLELESSKTEQIHSFSASPKIESFQGRLHELGAITVMPDYFVDRFVRFNSIS